MMCFRERYEIAGHALVDSIILASIVVVTLALLPQNFAEYPTPQSRES